MDAMCNSGYCANCRAYHRSRLTGPILRALGKRDALKLLEQQEEIQIPERIRREGK